MAHIMKGIVERINKKKLEAQMINSKKSWHNSKFLLGVKPADNAEHVKLMNKVVAVLS
jgi:hypothetical protein